MGTDTQEVRGYSLHGSERRQSNNPLTVRIELAHIPAGLQKLLVLAVTARLLGVNLEEVGALMIRSMSPRTFIALTSALDTLRHWLL